MRRKKLIEVALPLDAINEASVAEQKNPFLKGHPRSAHPWWARRPQAACRAVIFASLVDDPSTRPEDFPSEEEQSVERRRLFGIIERLVSWENANKKSILDEAKTEIAKSNPKGFPQAYDPFAGRGSITLEAQRLGLETFASDFVPPQLEMENGVLPLI
jgi:putative DNA methylase